ncbi:MAG: amidohydrolase [Chloroflexi bacterium]|nr:amidohydrolase [Chloroflexota bacterium]
MLILANAQIRTLNAKQPAASALVIDDHAPHAGRILAVGETDTLLAEFSGRAAVEDMAMRIILPGLTDAHIHLRKYTQSLSLLDCATITRAECVQRVAKQAAETPPGEWIQGHGWNQNDWETGLGNAADLDAVAPHNPVYLTGISLHVAWVNSPALKAAGIDKNTPDPNPRAIQRDDRGEPTGILYEKASDLIPKVIPRPSLEQDVLDIKNAQETLWQVGLTGVHDFDKRSSFEALQTLHSRGELGLRALKSIPEERLEHAIGIGLHSGFGNDMLRIGGVKMFADGALGPHTAAMFEPYEDEAENLGMLLLDREEIFEVARQAAHGGLSMTIHSIGDHANHEVLAAYAQLRDYEVAEGLPALRHRLEHAQVLHPDDMAKFAELNISASMQPIHATADMEMVDKFWGKRAETAYAWRSLQEKGAHLVFGSDAPVDSPNPFWGLHAAVTRQRRDGSPGSEGWQPHQRLDIETALQGYTTGPAYVAGMEERLGMLAPGYLADLIVLETDPFTCPPQELFSISPQATMLGGDWVWQK